MNATRTLSSPWMMGRFGPVEDGCWRMASFTSLRRSPGSNGLVM